MLVADKLANGEEPIESRLRAPHNRYRDGVPPPGIFWLFEVIRKNGSAGQNLSGRARAIFTRAVNLRGFPPGVPTGVGKNIALLLAVDPPTAQEAETKPGTQWEASPPATRFP